MAKRKSSNRRQFIKRVGATGAVGMFGLSGCLGGGGDGGDGGGDGGDGGSDGSGSGSDGGSGGASTDTPSPEPRGDAAVREEYGLPAPSYPLEDNLNVFQWADYWPLSEDFHTIEVFEQAYDVTVNVSNYASNEEMFNKLKAGGTSQFDVIFPSDYMVNILISQEMVEPLDLDKLTHWENLEQRWVDEAPYDSGSERYSSPYQWGTSGIAWNADVTPDVDASSWDALWNEAYAGQINMLDDMRETIGASLKRLGYSLNSKDEAEIAEARDELIAQKELLQTYDSVNMDEALISGDGSPIHTWSGSAFSAYWELWADGSSPIGYQVPDEGGVVWIDTAAIPKDAEHPNSAHAFINYTLNAKVNAAITNYVYYATPNAAAKEYVAEDALNNTAIYPTDDAMAKLEFIRNLGDATTLWSEAWTEIKNA